MTSSEWVKLVRPLKRTHIVPTYFPRTYVRGYSCSALRGCGRLGTEECRQCRFLSRRTIRGANRTTSLGMTVLSAEGSARVNSCPARLRAMDRQPTTDECLRRSEQN